MNALQQYELMDIEEIQSQEQKFEISDLNSLNWSFRKIAALKQQEKEIKQLADVERERINTWEQDSLNPIHNSISFFEGLVQAYHAKQLAEDPKKNKTISTPYGKSKTRRSSESVEKQNEEALLQYVIENDIHIIATLRAKQEYQAEKDDNDKLQIKKMGLKPIQKDDLEYEFMIVLRTEQNHIAIPTKDNSNLLNENGELITPEHGAKIYQWLELGIDVKEEEEKKRTSLIEQVKLIVNHSDEAAKKLAEFEFKANMKLDDFTIKLAQAAFDRLQTFK